MSSLSANERLRPPKTVHIFLGYFFIVNYCLGTGFLGIPYLFFYSGYLAAIPTLSLIAFLTWLTSQWLLEVMARAQAIEYYKRTKKSDNAQSNLHQQPMFEITLNRKFETSELSEMFVGRWLKYIYLVLVVVYGFFGCWSFSAVAGSAWATNIPYRFGTMEVCEGDAFLHRTLPSTNGCLYSYYFGVFLFGLIVITLSVMDLREQVIVHVFFGVLRYLTIAVIIIYCIVKLALGGKACAEVYPELPPNETIAAGISYGEIVLHFDPKTWMISIPVFVYAFMIHSGVSSLTHPIKQKKYLHWMMVTNFAIAAICLLTLGIVVPLWFRESVQETITLNWAIFTRPGNPPWLQVLSYYLVLFVSMDVVSAYPLTIHAMVNNIYIIITGHDTSEHPKWRLDWLLRLLLRLTVASIPLFAAFGVSNLIFVLKYAGLLGFGVCFLYPTILQLASTYVCVREFGNKAQLNKSSASGAGGRQGESSELEQKNRTDTTELSSGSEEAKHGHGKEEKSPLLREREDTDSKPSRLYMTPYSNVVMSHPIFVGTVAVIEACLSVLAFASVFIEPSILACDLLR